MRGSMTSSALKKIIVPFDKRDPVETLAALISAGMPAVLANLKDANTKLYGLMWKRGQTLGDFKTEIEDVGRQLVAAGGKELDDSALRAIMERAVLDAHNTEFKTAIQVLNSTGEVSAPKWWSDLLAVESSENATGHGVWGKATSMKGGGKQRAHAAVEEREEREPYERPSRRDGGCRICHGDHIAKYCPSDLAVTCPSCHWVRPKSEPKCTSPRCKGKQPTRKGKETAKVTQDDRESYGDPDELMKTVALMARGMERIEKRGKRIRRLDRLERGGSERDPCSGSEEGEI